MTESEKNNQNDNNKDGETTNSKEDITKILHKGGTIASFFFVGSGSVLLIVLSRVFHKETDKLHELNDIFKNPKARVVIGKDNGTQVIKKMKKITKQKQLMEVVKPVKKRKMVKASRSRATQMYEEEEKVFEPSPNQSFAYSLYDDHGQIEDQNTLYPSISGSKSEIEMRPIPQKSSSVNNRCCDTYPVHTE